MGDLGVGVNDTEDLGFSGKGSLGGGGGRTVRAFARAVLAGVVLTLRAAEGVFGKVGVFERGGTLGGGGLDCFLV